MKPVCFLHTADLHLGSPLKSIGSVSPAIRDQLQDATLNALKRIVDAAIRYDVDFVVFSGDVFDADSRSVRSNQKLIEQLERLHLSEIAAFMIGGNHDPITATYRESITLPPNTIIFPSDRVVQETVYRDGEPVARLLGQSYRGNADSRKMYDGYSVPDDSVWNIALLHSALDTNTKKYVPCTSDDLKSKQDIHYWAMGHLHTRQILSDHYPIIAFPGIPQGRDIGEPGIGSCFLVELAPNATPNITPVATASVVWLNATFSVDDDVGQHLRTLDELAEAMESVAVARLEDFLGKTVDEFDKNSKPEVEGAIIRWQVTGRGEIHELLADDREESAQIIEQHLRNRLGDHYPFIWTESVQIRTAPEIPSLTEMAKKSDTFRDLLNVVHELGENTRKPDLNEAVGKIWATDGDAESLDPEKFLLDSATLDELLDEAANRVIEAILNEREQS